MLQDCYTRRVPPGAATAPDKLRSRDPASQPAGTRTRFLHAAYREIISRFVSFGLIEHPLPLMRSFVKFLEQLSKSVDCRVDDFRGIGFYVLLQDGETFYLLASREGRLRMRTASGFESLATREIPGVTELSVETTRAQKELFSDDLRDFLALYRIDATELDAPDGALDLALGGSGEEMDTLVEALEQPGVVEIGVAEKTIPLNLVSHKMLYVRFDGLVRIRDLYADTFAPSRTRATRRRLIQVVSAVVVVSLGAVWLSERLSRQDAEVVAQSASLPVAESVPTTGSGMGEVAPAATEETAEPAGDTANESQHEVVHEVVHLSLAWDKTYNQPITSTPLVSGDRVIFGGRDGNLYALSGENGSVLWRYKAAGGIGASPRVSDKRVISADYNGNVFAVGLEDGKRVWNRKLPGKVVSTPCLGDGEVLVGCYNGTAYALSVETGRVLWRLSTGARIRASAAFSDGRYYVPSYNGKLYSVTAGTGTVRWETRLEGRLSSSPAVWGSLLVIGGPKGSIYGLNTETGTIRWKYRAQGPVDAFVLQEGGKVFAGSNDKHLYCLDAASGNLLWKYETKGVILGRAVVTGDYAIFPSYDGTVYCVNLETGLEVDQFETNGPVFSSPTLGTDRVYFGNNKGKFYCLSLRGKEAS